MIALDKQSIEFPCPFCDFYNHIFLKQACLRDVIICRGCKSNIRLDDQINECRKAIRSFKKAMRELEGSFSNFKI